MTILIRPLETDDRAAWQALWQGYLDFYRKDLSAEVTDATWARLLDPDWDMHGLCAVGADGDMLGFVHYLYHPVTWAIDPRCYLEDLFVSERARGAGAGRLLIDAVYAAADERGTDQVYWLTQDSNTTARALYDRVARLTPFIKYQR